MKISYIRVCLQPDGTVEYYAGSDDDLEGQLDTEEALHLMTGGRIPIEIVTRDPQDDSVHNYESLRGEESNVTPGVTTTTILLSYI